MVLRETLRDIVPGATTCRERKFGKPMRKKRKSSWALQKQESCQNVSFIVHNTTSVLWRIGVLRSRRRNEPSEARVMAATTY